MFGGEMVLVGGVCKNGDIFVASELFEFSDIGHDNFITCKLNLIGQYKYLKVSNFQ